MAVPRRLNCGKSFIIGLISVFISLVVSAPSALAKVYFYTLTDDGTLVRYDPDDDRVHLRPGAGRGYIDPRLEDPGPDPELRILDMKRKRIVTNAVNAHAVVINLDTGTATEVRLALPGSVKRFEQFIYPRKASRFYMQWQREAGPAGTLDIVWTTVGLDGRIIDSLPSMLPSRDWPVYHPDGRSFYTHAERILRLIDGESLAVVASYDLMPLMRQGFAVPRLNDVRDGRALFAEGSTDRTVASLFTTDLTFNPSSASPRMSIGVDVYRVLLAPGARTVLAQDRRKPAEGVGGGRLHFYDVASGSKLGVLDFPAPSGAELLGFHPDGRRLFIRARAVDTSTPDFEVKTRLLIIDLVTRTVIRNRPFEEIGFASDFVDEPQ